MVPAAQASRSGSRRASSAGYGGGREPFDHAGPVPRTTPPPARRSTATARNRRFRSCSPGPPRATSRTRDAIRREPECLGEQIGRTPASVWVAHGPTKRRSHHARLDRNHQCRRGSAAAAGLRAARGAPHIETTRAAVPSARCSPATAQASETRSRWRPAPPAERRPNPAHTRAHVVRPERRFAHQRGHRLARERQQDGPPWWRAIRSGHRRLDPVRGTRPRGTESRAGNRMLDWLCVGPSSPGGRA
jgi:hypothetical protein